MRRYVRWGLVVAALLCGASLFGCGNEGGCQACAIALWGG